jgi:predicted transcriptional regulator
LTDDERTFAEALERALTEHADVWQALADRDAGKGVK